MIAAICCGLAALCYAEFASTVPVSGSAYTFSYATLGELVAWIIGWDLILEMMLGASVVAQGWSAYFVTFLDADRPRLARGSRAHRRPTSALQPGGVPAGRDPHRDRDLGIKESMRVNLVLVGVKLFVVLFVIVAGICSTSTPTTTTRSSRRRCRPRERASGCTPRCSSWSSASPAAYGVGGVVFGASVVFFAYIGFDVVATAAEEAAHPQSDLPRGIIGSLIICTILYVAVALVITGMVNYEDIAPSAALARPSGPRARTASPP